MPTERLMPKLLRDEDSLCVPDCCMQCSHRWDITLWGLVVRVACREGLTMREGCARQNGQQTTSGPPTQGPIFRANS